MYVIYIEKFLGKKNQYFNEKMPAVLKVNKILGFPLFFSHFLESRHPELFSRIIFKISLYSDLTLCNHPSPCRLYNGTY